MRLRRKRYDPFPDLLALRGRMVTEVDELAEAGSISPKFAGIAQDSINQTVRDFTMYATIGKDRNKLTPKFVSDAEEQMRSSIDMAKVFGRRRSTQV
jgi:hypothetical protein